MMEPCYIRSIERRPVADVLQNRCFDNFSKFTKKYLCWSPLLIEPIQTQESKIFKSTIFTEHVGRLLLDVSRKITCFNEPRVWSGLLLPSVLLLKVKL